jgi:hypothetical protein
MSRKRLAFIAAKATAAGPGSTLPKTPPMVCRTAWINVSADAMRRKRTGLVMLYLLMRAS